MLECRCSCLYQLLGEFRSAHLDLGGGDESGPTDGVGSGARLGSSRLLRCYGPA